MDNCYWWAEDTEDNRTYKIIFNACITYLILLPLSCLKDLSFMKFNSLITVVCISIITIVIIVYFFLYDGERKEPVPFKTGFSVMTTLPLMSAG